MNIEYEECIHSQGQLSSGVELLILLCKGSILEVDQLIMTCMYSAGRARQLCFIAGPRIHLVLDEPFRICLINFAFTSQLVFLSLNHAWQFYSVLFTIMWFLGVWLEVHLPFCFLRQGFPFAPQTALKFRVLLCVCLSLSSA